MSLLKGFIIGVPVVIFALTFVYKFATNARSNLVFGVLNVLIGPVVGGAIVALLAPLLAPLPRLNIVWTRNTIEAYLGCLLAADLAFYLVHRISHKVPLLWRLHRFHHSAEHMNVSVHYRHSVWSIVPNAVVIALIAHILNFHISSVIFFFTLVSLYQLFLHSTFNRFPLFLEVVLLSPRAHHRHHHRQDMRKNLGGMFTLWDRVFRTYLAPDHRLPVQYGVGGWRSRAQFVEWLGLDVFRVENDYLLDPASPLSQPESPQDPPPSVPQPSPPAPAIKIE